jgi:ribosomal protein L7/L12
MLTITIETQNPSLARDIIALAQANKAAVKLARSGEAINRKYDFDKGLLIAEMGGCATHEALTKFEEIAAKAIEKKDPILLIKAVREYSGLGLREAKDLVDKFTLS